MLSWEELSFSSDYVGSVRPVFVYFTSFPQNQNLNKLQSTPVLLQLRARIPFFFFFFLPLSCRKHTVNPQLSSRHHFTEAGKVLLLPACFGSSACLPWEPAMEYLMPAIRSAAATLLFCREHHATLIGADGNQYEPFLSLYLKGHMIYWLVYQILARVVFCLVCGRSALTHSGSVDLLRAKPE